MAALEVERQNATFPGFRLGLGSSLREKYTEYTWARLLALPVDDRRGLRLELRIYAWKLGGERYPFFELVRPASDVTRAIALAREAVTTETSAAAVVGWAQRPGDSPVVFRLACVRRKEKIH